MKLCCNLFLILILLGAQLFSPIYADSTKIKDPSTGHEYQRFDISMSWIDAKNYCESKGGHLATITSADEDNFVFSNLISNVPENIEMCWIGGTDEENEDDWKWVTGETWSYTNWSQYAPEPNNCSGIEHYLTIFSPWDPLGRGGTWNDLGVFGSRGCGCNCPSEVYDVYTICEWDNENEDKSLTVIYPNGNEQWLVGTQPTISWTSTGTFENVKIQISTDNGNNWSIIVSSTPNNGSFSPSSWTVPNEPSSQCLIKISGTDGEPTDVSDSPFSIFVNQPALSGKLQIKSPSGETWDINKIQNESYVKISTPINLSLRVNYDGTFSSGQEIIPTGTYEVTSYLNYYDNITINNILIGAPSSGRILRTAKWTSTIQIQEGVPQTLNIDYHLPVFLIHGILSGYTTWNNWVEYLNNKGYISFTPNHRFMSFLKTDEASQILNQYNLDMKGLFNELMPDVFFVCHSEGGVATRVFVNTYKTIAQRIKQIYTIGTPHSGTDFPGAVLFSLDRVRMCNYFNGIYPTFNNVPVYAISGHGALPNDDDCELLNDGVVYWNSTIDEIESVNVSPFFIKVFHKFEYISTTEFKGFSPSYTTNGHHFCYNHSNLISKGLQSILAGTIIPTMKNNELADFRESKFTGYSNITATNQDYANLSIIEETFYLAPNSSKEYEVNISSTNLATFYALMVLGDINLILTDPDGIEIDSVNFNSYGSINYSNTDLGIMYSIPNPKTGLWKLKINSNNTGNYVALAVRENSTWGISGYTDKVEYLPNAEAVLNAKIIGNSSSSDNTYIQVNGYDTDMNEIFSLNLLDDGSHYDQNPGDGIYGNVMTVPLTEGYYRLKFKAKTSISGEVVQRECMWGFAVSGDISSYEISINRDKLYYGAFEQYVTESQSFMINPGSQESNWTVTDNQTWITCTPNNGTGDGIVSVSINPSGLSEGSYSGTITVTDLNSSNISQSISVTLNVYNSNQLSPPFGNFATPIDGTTVRSSIPITGWVLDDLGVKSVKIYRGEDNNLVYIGDAVFVEGARPDVEQIYSEYPSNYKAGWGYMMLTNFLPNKGNGTFRIRAIATDIEGRQIELGIKTIICDNINAVKPFGAIDTPTQGGIASGNNFINWGWVLTPQPNSIPTDGSTINVFVDGIDFGHPNYNIYRQDVANLFPEYANANGAVGYFSFDTTTFKNGVHTIAWRALDSGNNSDGIGSRYFTIMNTGYSNSTFYDTHSNQIMANQKLFNLFKKEEFQVDNTEPIILKKGYNSHIQPEVVECNESGVYCIKTNELEQLEIEFPGEHSLINGYTVVGNQLKSLPIGSFLHFEEKKFHWQLGPGFFGSYSFIFMERGNDNQIYKKIVIIEIEPKFLAP